MTVEEEAHEASQAASPQGNCLLIGRATAVLGVHRFTIGENWSLSTPPQLRQRSK